MQPQELTLQVDPLNDDTIVPELYVRSDYFQNRSQYIGASHALDARDTIGLYRSYPTKNGNFKGVQKTAVKFTQDVTVNGVEGGTTLSAPVIGEINFSIPVGAPSADALKLRQRMIAILDDDTTMDALNLQLLV